MTRLLNLLLAALFVAFPSAAVVVVASKVDATPEELAPATEIELALVTERSDDGEQAVVVQLSLAEGTRLYAPTWSGVIQEVMMGAGEAITPGDVLAVIDGTPRIALQTPQPMFRALRIGDTGADVKQLHRALALLGFDLDSESDRFGSDSRSAIRALMERNGASQVREFDPAHFVWLPSPDLVISETALVPGTPAPTGGTVIAKSRPMVVQADVSSTDGEPIVGPGFELEVDGQHIGALQEGAIDGDQRRLLLELFESGEIESAADSDDAESSTSSPLLKFDGMIRLTDPLVVETVPASAVIGDGAGNQCVIVLPADGIAYSFATSVVDGGFGWNAIEPAPTDPVIANPLDIEAFVPCGS